MAERSAAMVTGPGVALTPSLPAPPTMPRTRLLWGGLVFGALTAGVFWRLFASVAGADAGPALGDLRRGYLALLLPLLGVSLWTCLQSELANAAISSLSIMADVVPPGIAPHYNLLRRFATSYLAALAGFLCLGRAMARDGSEPARRPPEPHELRGGPGS
jgi:hypothetical protein